MGFDAIKTVAAPAATSDHATFALALAQAQSDATAGKTYRVVAAGEPGHDYRYSAGLDYLVPARWYVNDTDPTIVDDGAGGDASLVETDTVASLPTGWAVDKAGTGDVTDDGGNILCEAGSSYGFVKFTPSTSATRFGIICVAGCTTSAADNDVVIDWLTGTYYIRVSLGDGGTEGDVGSATSFVGGYSVGTSIVTHFVEVDLTAATSMTKAWTPTANTGEYFACQRSNWGTGASTRLSFTVQGSASAVGRLDRLQMVELAG